MAGLSHREVNGNYLTIIPPFRPQRVKSESRCAIPIRQLQQQQQQQQHRTTNSRIFIGRDPVIYSLI